MKKIIGVIMAVIIVTIGTTFLLNSGDIKTSKETLSTEEILLLKSEQVFENLSVLNWAELSKEVHPNKGLTFSFYADLGSPYSHEITFTKSEVEKLSSDNQVYTWGYDLSDRPFDFTVNDYVKDNLLMHYTGAQLDYSNVTYHASSVDSGGILNTISEYYPAAKYVEYHSPSEDINWQALRFVYEKVEKEWYLFAIVRDVHSP